MTSELLRDAGPVTPMARGARRRERTRRQLLDAGRQVIGEKGVDAATIGEIAEAADVAFGSFYNHFDSKDDLVEAVFAEAIEQHRDAIDLINDGLDGPDQMLANAVRFTIHMGARDPLWGLLVLRLATGSNDIVAPLLGRLERDLTIGVERDVFRIDDIPTVRAAIQGVAMSVLAARLAGELDASSEWTAAEAVLRTAGMTPSAARATVKRVRAVVTAAEPAGEP